MSYEPWFAARAVLARTHLDNAGRKCEGRFHVIDRADAIYGEKETR